MRLRKGKGQVIVTERLRLRLPENSDLASWIQLRSEGRAFLEPWEPAWKKDALSKEAFLSRVEWSESAASKKTALPLLIIRRIDNVLVGSVTLDNIRLGPHKSASLGYWIGECFSRQGYMKEAIDSLVYHAFSEIGLSRIEAACVPDNIPSRRLLETTGFRYEGVAQSYLEVAGRWRAHVLYANLRRDRRSRALVD